MYQVLARKWRPKKFQEVIGQEHITRTLINAITSNKVAHAYLFTGTRGVGKTTIARLFAKAIKCESLTEDKNPCGKCGSCQAIDSTNSLDYLEIDGASNNGVDNIRELIENVQYLPSSGKYKVYVIDEVHMLSTGAFNALLKTLEEPPEHVVFIFATTDPHKLLGTVLSRCQRFDFKTVDSETLVKHIEKIAKAEEIVFEDKKLIKILADHGDGSVRDTLSLLDQVLSLSIDSNINEDDLFASLGLINKKLINNIIISILNTDKELFIDSFNNVKAENISYEKFLNQVLDELFLILDNIDTLEQVGSDIKEETNLNLISSAELMWIYESIIKDSNWALSSFDIARSIKFILLKVVAREEVLGIDSDNKKKTKIIEKKPEEDLQVNDAVEEVALDEEPTKEQVNDVATETIDQLEHIEAVEEEVIKKPAKEKEKNWENFVEYLKNVSQGISVNLERAIFDDIYDFENPILKFSEDDKIFYDFLNEPNHFKTLKEVFAQYNNKDISEIDLKIKLIDDQTKKDDNLMSKVEKDQESEDVIKREQEERLITNKFVKQAEDLFNTKISKVILNENKKD